jgi:hypothetical protein
MTAATVSDVLAAMRSAQSVLAALVQMRAVPGHTEAVDALTDALLAIRPDAPQVPVAQAMAVHVADLLELFEAMPAAVATDLSAARNALEVVLDGLASVADGSTGARCQVEAAGHGA